ncbi:FAD-dependent oxidoreductase [Streptomyces sp. NPDC003327]
MTYAITQTCCNDATCVAVCPVNCIHPTPDEPDFGTTEMLYIDPRSCIDCGACADACPVDAIFPADRLTGRLREYEAVNAAHFADRPPAPAAASPTFHAWGEPTFDRSLPADFAPVRVAIVGTGPAGMYAAEDLLLHTNAEVTLIDRLPVAGGLVRYGVAPDHPATRGAGDTLGRFHHHPRVRMRLGVEIGKDVSAEELAAHHDAVIYAVGAPADRRLGIPGEELTGSVAATTVVSWYNGHPETGADAVDPAGTERVVVVGNGNVALDVARLLVADPAALARTDIADHALAALRGALVREVVLLGRRGPEDAAYTASELRALRHVPGLDLLVDDHDPRVGKAIDAAAPGEKAALLKDVPRAAVDWSAPPAPDRRRIVLRFHSAPVEVLGSAAGAVRAVRIGGGVADADAPAEPVDVAAGLLVRAIGYRGVRIPGLPFDETTGTVPHTAGRVEGMPGTYVVGWIKRGPSGGIGANRTCSHETVGTLLGDAVAGALPTPTGTPKAFARLARSRSRGLVDARGMAAIDRLERSRGAAAGRPRVKLTTVPELVAAARGAGRWRRRSG